MIFHAFDGRKTLRKFSCGLYVTCMFDFKNVFCKDRLGKSARDSNEHWI